MSDVIEVHLLELRKLQRLSNSDDPVIDLMKILNADSKGVMEMLVENNSGISKAYKILEAMSKDEKTGLFYEARQMAIMDELTRIEEAKEEAKIDIAKKLLDVLDDDVIADKTGFSVEEVRRLRTQS